MAYSKQTWDTTSYVNPTRMNHIEDGIETAQATADTNSASIANIVASLVAQSGCTTEFGTFYQTVKWNGTNYNNIPITGIKITTNVNSRYAIIGVVLSGSYLGNKFIAYSSWGGTSVVLTGEVV